MSLPPNIEKNLADLARLRTEASDRKARAEADLARQLEELSRTRREQGMPSARAIEAWLHGPLVQRLLALAQLAGLDSIQVLDPSETRGRRNGGHPGLTRVDLVHGPALRTPGGGRYAPVRRATNAEELCGQLMVDDLTQLASDIESGRVWDTVARSLEGRLEGSSTSLDV